MNKKLFTSLLLAGLLSFNPVFAQTDVAIDSEAPEQLIESAASVNVNAAADSFDDWVAETEQQFGQAIGVSKQGTVFYKGEGVVNGSPLDANFGKQLALAYERAMFDMRADFILQNYGRLVSKSILDMYEDSSSNRDDFDPVEIEKAGETGGNKLFALFDKAMTLIDKKLDNELIEQGVPADEVKEMTVEQKKTVYKNNFSVAIFKKAFHSMQGLVPVKTKIFNTETDNGTAISVGIIAVQSQKTRQFAKDVSRKQKSLVTGNPKSLTDILPATNDGYLNEIGLRYAYDESGHPMLLSYGRTSVSISPDWKPARAKQAEQNATSMARMLAESSIVEFVNTNVQVEESGDLGSLDEEQLSRLTTFNGSQKGDVQDTREFVEETVSTIIKSGKATAQGDLRGTSVVKTWRAKDENNVLHVGSVVSWTYDQLANANAIDKGTKSAVTKSSGNAAASAKSRASKTVNDKSDF